MVTLYHWDLPQVLEDAGGWPERATAEAFVEYAEVVADRLGDRVTRWITHNEPWVASWLGYGWGQHAPGRTSERGRAGAAHHLLWSHGLAVEVLRRASPRAEVGISLNLLDAVPASTAPRTPHAARLVDGHANRWFLDPLFRGGYPDDLPFGTRRCTTATSSDRRADRLPRDQLLRPRGERAGADGAWPTPAHVPGSAYTDMGWEVFPDGLRDTLVRVHHDYGPQAIYVTENGAAFGDVRGHDGSVLDPERQDYLRDHIAAVGQAIDAGAPVRGYFVWSLLDNFEWAFGYAKRFGLVFVDYPTLERVPKGLFGWYRDFIASQRETEWRASA